MLRIRAGESSQTLSADHHMRRLSGDYLGACFWRGFYRRGYYVLFCLMLLLVSSMENLEQISNHAKNQDSYKRRNQNFITLRVATVI